MSELLIKQNKHNLHFMPWVWLIFIFYAFFHFLSNGFSQNAIIAFLTIFGLITTVNWAVFQSSKREVLINKKDNEVTVFITNFLGKKSNKIYLINDFIGIRSYIYSGNDFAPNYVDLVFTDGKRGLLLSSFNHWSGDRFFKHDWYENKEATQLRDTVSKLTGLGDLGFIGKKWLGFPQAD